MKEIIFLAAYIHIERTSNYEFKQKDFSSKYVGEENETISDVQILYACFVQKLKIWYL